MSKPDNYGPIKSKSDARAIREVILLARNDLTCPNAQWGLDSDRALRIVYSGPPHLWPVYHRTVRRKVESKND